jgi:hypothetical protein
MIHSDTVRRPAASASGSLAQGAVAYHEGISAQAWLAGYAESNEYV